MPAERKLTDEDVARLRALAADGWSNQELADGFGVTPQHVGRLVRGERRAEIAGLDAEALHGGGVLVAVDGFLGDIELREPGDRVLAATALMLASKLDACARSESATAAQAAPRLAAQLVDVLDRLRAGVPREPDAIDLLRQRRNARRLAMAAQYETSIDKELT